MKSTESAGRKKSLPKKSPRFMAALLSLGLGLCGVHTAYAQEEIKPEPTEQEPSKLYDGSYISPMVTGVFQTNKTPLDDGIGGTLAVGWRKGFYGFEIAPTYVDVNNAKIIGAAVNALLYPLKSLPNLYGTLGLSGLYYQDYATAIDKKDFNTVNVDAGFGYLFPLQSGRYDWAIRAEARYRVGRRERDYNDLDIDIDAPRRFRQAVVNIGLYLPLGLRPVPPPPPPPVVVVPPAATCGDGIDNDGDSVIDYPADQGCTSLDDTDETDPLRCIAPKPGERLSLAGCGTGDVIVLRGVNFDFDMARLTPDAQTILDTVGEELTAYPDIQVELGGHTDAIGSDDYNQKLSEQRAQAVAEYLRGKGITASRMTSVGYGESQPVADNESDEGRELNRRTELKVISGNTSPAAGVAASTPAAPVAPIP